MSEEEQEGTDFQDVDLRLERDEDGNVKPIEGVSPRFGYKIVARPITFGQSREIDSWGQAILEWSAEDKARVLRENLVEPDDFEDVTIEELYDNFEAFAVEDIVQGIAFLSGYGRFFEGDEDEGVGKVPEEVQNL